MKEYTKQLYKLSDSDFIRIHQHNNSKWDKMTEAQKAQAVQDKKAFYTRLWNERLQESTTKRQKDICKNMLSFIERNAK